MKLKIFNDLLVFTLFGIALGFYGILYEGVVYGPKFIDVSMERMQFWKSFTAVINPIPYYIPLYPVAAFLLLVLSFVVPKERSELRKRLLAASAFQIISLALTFYILTQINFKRSFGNLDKYAAEISGKAALFNILSIMRIGLSGIVVAIVFKACMRTQKERISTSII